MLAPVGKLYAVAIAFALRFSSRFERTLGSCDLNMSCFGGGEFTEQYNQVCEDCMLRKIFGKLQLDQAVGKSSTKCSDPWIRIKVVLSISMNFFTKFNIDYSQFSKRVLRSLMLVAMVI